MIDFGNLYEKQMAIRNAVVEGIRRIAFIGSIQVGKSFLGARLLLEQVFTNDNPKSDLIICVSPTFKMSRVMVREFEKILKQDDRLWKSVHKRRSVPVTFTFPNGKTVEFHSAENPDSLRGLRPVFVLLDEGAYISLEAYRIIEGRTLETGGIITITTTPRGKRHWLFREVFVKGAPPGHPQHDPNEYDPERFFVQVATVYDNPYIAEAERQALIKSYGGEGSRQARQELFGEFVDFKGIVLDRFDEAVHVVAHEEMPQAFEYVAGGVDFGFPAPSTSYVLGFRKGVWYVTDEFYERRVEIDALGAEMAAQRSQFRVSRFWADSADPGRISHYQKSGLPVYPVVKPRILQRLDYLNSLFAQNRVMIDSNCVELLNELTSLSWPDDADLDNPSIKPIGSDHGIDGITYPLWSERSWLTSYTPQHLDDDDWGVPLSGGTPTRVTTVSAGYPGAES